MTSNSFTTITSIHIKNWVMGFWSGYLSGARCRFAYYPADATASYCLLLWTVKSRLVLSFWYQMTWDNGSVSGNCCCTATNSVTAELLHDPDQCLLVLPVCTNSFEHVTASNIWNNLPYTCIPITLAIDNSFINWRCFYVLIRGILESICLKSCASQMD